MKNLFIIIVSVLVGEFAGILFTIHNLKPIDIIQVNGEGKTTIGIELCGQVWNYELNEKGDKSVNE